MHVLSALQHTFSAKLMSFVITDLRQKGTKKFMSSKRLKLKLQRIEVSNKRHGYG